LKNVFNKTINIINIIEFTKTLNTAESFFIKDF